ncbi:MAG: hypothetical protein H7Z43_04165 [Clostridia bacterium]|nr:hypothetical protein [Deltaproteobacteria bacterium]
MKYAPLKYGLLLTAIACTIACGDDSAATDDTGSDLSTVRLASTIQPNTETIGVFGFSPRDKDNIIVTCTSLLTGNPQDARYAIIQSQDFNYPGDGTDAVTLANIKSKDPVIIYVNARDSRNTVIGEGCAEDVELKTAVRQTSELPSTRRPKMRDDLLSCNTKLQPETHRVHCRQFRFSLACRCPQ